MRDPNPYATLTRHCPEHGEYEQDCDKPETGCPTCAATPPAPAAPQDADDMIRTAFELCNEAKGALDMDHDFDAPTRQMLDRVGIAVREVQRHLLSIQRSVAAAPDAEREPTNADRLALARRYGLDAHDSPEHGGICYDASDADIERLVDALLARAASPAPSSGGGANA